MTKPHNITSITIEPCSDFKMTTRLKTGKEIVLTGQKAIDVFLEMIPVICEKETIH